MSQIVSSLPNKFEQGIFAALCFDFSLSKNLVIYRQPLQADYFLMLCPRKNFRLSIVQIPVVIGSAKVKPFFTPATISLKKFILFQTMALKGFSISLIEMKKNIIYFLNDFYKVKLFLHDVKFNALILRHINSLYKIYILGCETAL